MTLRWYYTLCSTFALCQSLHSVAAPMHYRASNSLHSVGIADRLLSETCGSLNCNVICFFGEFLEVKLSTIDIVFASWSRGSWGNTNGPLFWFKPVWQKHLPCYYLFWEYGAELSPACCKCIISIYHDRERVKHSISGYKSEGSGRIQWGQSPVHWL